MADDPRCANCGREKAEHVKVADAEVNDGASDYPVLICPQRVYEPERHAADYKGLWNAAARSGDGTV